jgi:hypothetical protein
MLIATRWWLVIVLCCSIRGGANSADGVKGDSDVMWVGDRFSAEHRWQMVDTTSKTQDLRSDDERTDATGTDLYIYRPFVVTYLYETKFEIPPVVKRGIILGYSI